MISELLKELHKPEEREQEEEINQLNVDVKEFEKTGFPAENIAIKQQLEDIKEANNNIIRKNKFTKLKALYPHASTTIFHKYMHQEKPTIGLANLNDSTGKAERRVCTDKKYGYANDWIIPETSKVCFSIGIWNKEKRSKRCNETQEHTLCQLHFNSYEYIKSKFFKKTKCYKELSWLKVSIPILPKEIRSNLQEAIKDLPEAIPVIVWEAKEDWKPADPITGIIYESFFFLVDQYDMTQQEVLFTYNLSNQKIFNK